MAQPLTMEDVFAAPAYVINLDRRPERLRTTLPAVIDAGSRHAMDTILSPLDPAERDRLATDGIASALKGLDERSRRIVTERWLNVNDDGSGGMTLHELAADYGVSAERIRQIEVAAMKKMRAALAEAA